eukprot:6194598-Prorocentrum_lima.AAC.1
MAHRTPAILWFGSRRHQELGSKFLLHWDEDSFCTRIQSATSCLPENSELVLKWTSSGTRAASS